jgi:hypothetical protein
MNPHSGGGQGSDASTRRPEELDDEVLQLPGPFTSTPQL